MAVYKYSSSINDKISKVCNDSAVRVMLDFPKLDINNIEKIFDDLIHFLKDNHDEVGSTAYLIEIDFDDSSADTNITSKIISDELKGGKNILKINSSLNIVSTGSFTHGFSMSALSLYSKENEAVIAHMRNGVNLMIISKGVIIKEIDITDPTALAPILDKFNHTAENYKLSIKDFYNEKIRTNQTDHWYDKPKRILISGQTEKHFQNALVNWLNDHLSAKKINFSTRKISNDETDIEIIKHGGETYVLELKWMGKSSKTSYGIEKIEDSFDQIENYLELEPDVLEITLVAYDGRDIEEFNKLTSIEEKVGHWKEIRKCNTKALHERASGFVFHLVHLSASKRPHAK